MRLTGKSWIMWDILIWYLWFMGFNLMWFVFLFVGSLALKWYFVRLIIIGGCGVRGFSSFWRILSIIGGSSLEFSIILNILHGSKRSICLYLTRYIIFSIFSLILKFSSCGLILISIIHSSIFFNFMRSIGGSIGWFNKIRIIVFLSWQIVYFLNFISCDIIGFIVIIIRCLSLKFGTFLWTCMFAYV